MKNTETFLGLDNTQWFWILLVMLILGFILVASTPMLYNWIWNH